MADHQLGGSSPEPRTPRAAIAVTLLLILSIITLVVLQGLKRPMSSMQPDSVQFVPATQQVTPGQAITVTAGTVSVYLPQGAITVPGTISILPREPDLFPAAGDTIWTRPQVVNIEYDNAQGMPYPQVTFQQPAQVCFQLTAPQWTDYRQHPDNYQVHYYADDENPPHWVLLPQTTHPDRAQLCGQTQHFSLFALAIKGLVGLPNTGGTPFPTPRLYAP